MGLHHTKKLFHSKGSHQQTKRQPNEWEKIFARHVSGKELISKIYKELIQLNSKKIQLKNGQRSEQSFFQRRHINGQQIHEKMLNFINHQGNANQNHKITAYTCENNYYQKDKKYTSYGEHTGKPCTLLVGI